MRKIFRRWLLLLIALVFSLSIVSFNYGFSIYEKQYGADFLQVKLDYALKQLNKSHQKIHEFNTNYKHETLNLAFFISKLVQKNPKFLKVQKSLSELADDLDVEEINITNEKGIIVASSKKENKGKELEDKPSELPSNLFDDNSAWEKNDEAFFSKNREYSVKLNRFEAPGYIQIVRLYDALEVQKDSERKTSFLEGFEIGDTGFVLLIGSESKRILSSTYKNHVGRFAHEIGLTPIELWPDSGLFWIETKEGRYLCYRISTNLDLGAFLVGVYPEKELVQQRKETMIWLIISFMLVLIVSYFAISFLLNKVVISGILKTIHILHKITKGDLEQRVDIYSNPEFSSLSTGINTMVEALHKTMIERTARIEKELDLAKKIQMNAVPSKFPAFPNDSSFDVYAIMHPAREVGGDFYDFFTLSSDHSKLCFVIADVSDKGVPAAMFMMSAKALIKQFAERGLSPAKIFEETNRELKINNTTFTFVTVFLGILDTKTGRLVYSNAGHNMPIFKHENGVCEYIECDSGYILGAVAKAKFVDNEIYLKGTEGLLLYTDGVTEAENEDEKLYSDQRLLDVVNENPAKSSTEILDFVYNDVLAYRGKAKQSDDLTMLAVSYNRHTLELPANEDNLDKFCEFVDNFLDKQQCSDEFKAKIYVVLDEMISNVDKYAYKNKNENEKLLRLSCCIGGSPKALEIVLMDKGTPFDPLKEPDLNIDLPPKERPVGKMGIFVVKSMVDEMTYSYEDGYNIVKLKKFI
ncbi:MAG: SpoIIE family protein phosphatase [Alphaproteobacteria bacterium]|nr:SpoIIE family protein phosphatase [Alphaproteobacteria bacterium]